MRITITQENGKFSHVFMYEKGKIYASKLVEQDNWYVFRVAFAKLKAYGRRLVKWEVGTELNIRKSLRLA